MKPETPCGARSGDLSCAKREGHLSPRHGSGKMVWEADQTPIPRRATSTPTTPRAPSAPLDEDTTRYLARAASNVKTWTERRNEAIKAAHTAGGGVREIARATRLNVATVHNILYPRKRGQDA